MFSSTVRTTASRFAARAAVGTSTTSRAAVQPSMIAVRSFASVSYVYVSDIVCLHRVYMLVELDGGVIFVVCTSL